MVNIFKSKNEKCKLNTLAYVYFIQHKRLHMFKVGKSINIVKRVNFMGVSEFDSDSCIALELSSENLARKMESHIKHDLKQFHIHTDEALHHLRTKSGQSEWFYGDGWECLEERIRQYSLLYEFHRVNVDFPKFAYTRRAKSAYDADCIWTKRWYKRNKDLDSAGNFQNTLQIVLAQSEIANVWCINKLQFNVSLMAHDSLADESWWQEMIEKLQAQSYSELSKKYFMYQALTCFENTIIITFNGYLDERSAFDVENPYDLILEKLFAEALAIFRLTPREILN